MRDINRWIGTGRVTNDPDVRYTQGDKPMCISRFRMAVGRKFDKDNADFISCVAFGKTGEGIEKYVKKGTKLEVEGHIQTGSYTNKDGNKVYTTDVVVDDWGFAESKSAQQSQEQGQTQQTAPAQTNVNNGQGLDGFMNIPDAIDEEVPFS